MASGGLEHCSKCGAQFETRAAVLDLGQARGLFNLPSIPPRVSCPSCRHQFRAREMLYFGFITAGQLRIGVAIFILALTVFSLFFLFWQDPAWQGRA